MGSFLIAWLVGMGLHISKNTWETKNNRQNSPLPPSPGQLLVASGIYVGLAILAEVESLRSTATLAAWGYNIAIGLSWEQDITKNPGDQAYYQSKGVSTSRSIWWNPPKAGDDVLFPTGKNAPTTAKPTSTSTTSTTGTGTQVA